MVDNHFNWPVPMTDDYLEIFTHDHLPFKFAPGGHQLTIHVP